MTLPRLIFVTGKGGTGKSTVAAALALALSRRHRTTLADLDRRRSSLALVGVEANGDLHAVRVSESLHALALSPRAELEKFIHGIVPVRAISARMLRSRTFGYVTAALPGLEAFLVLERLRLLTGESARDDQRLVVDAPASGGALELLSVAQGLRALAPSGTLNRLAAQVQSFLTTPALFGVILTVTPEEMALREALETASMLQSKLRVRCVGAVINGAAGAMFTRAELAALAPFEHHSRFATRRNAMAEFTVRAREQLKAARLQVIELPALFRAELGRDEIEHLSHRLEARLRK